MTSPGRLSQSPLYQQTIESLKRQSALSRPLLGMIDQEVSALAQGNLSELATRFFDEQSKATSAEPDRQDSSPLASGLPVERSILEEAIVACAKEHFQIALQRAKQKEEAMFSIPNTPSVNTLSRTIHEPVAPYTCLRHSLRPFSQIELIGRASDFTLPVMQAIAFTPKRMALQIVAREFVFHYALGKGDLALDAQLQRLVPEAVQAFLATQPDFGEKMSLYHRQAESMVLEHLTEATPFLEELAPFVVIAQQELLSQAIPPDEKVRAIAMRSADLAYQKKVESTLKAFSLQNLAESWGLRPIPAQSDDTRRIFMINGGIASGKGTAERNLAARARSEGVNWDEVVMINKDSFKPLLLDVDELDTADRIRFSGLAHDEATLIWTSILNKYKQHLSERRAPHLHIDQNAPDKGIILWGASSNPRGIDVTVVQMPAEKSFQLAYSRGELTRRFETTAGILGNHAAVPKQLDEALRAVATATCHNLRLRLVDNLGPGELADIAYLDAAQGTGQISDYAHFLEFYRKTALNQKATHFEEMYRPQDCDLELYRPYIDTWRRLCPRAFTLSEPS